MREFRDTYHVIMVVHDRYLRNWNEIDMNRRVLFDEIWVTYNIDDMISSIKSRPVLGNLDAGYIICPSCYKKADDMGKIRRGFCLQDGEGWLFYGSAAVQGLLVDENASTCKHSAII